MAPTSAGFALGRLAWVAASVLRQDSISIEPSRREARLLHSQIDKQSLVYLAYRSAKREVEQVDGMSQLSLRHASIK